MDPNTNPTPPPITPVPTPTKPMPASNTLIILLVGLVLMLLGIAGYVLFQNVMLQSKMKTMQTIIVTTPQASTAPNQTSNWLTYTSKDGSFTFKYPEDFKEIKPQKPFYTLSTPIVAFQSSLSDYKAPNYLQESFVEVSSQKGLPLAECYSSTDPTMDVNGTVFYIQTPEGGNAAGNHYDTTLYRTGAISNCFEVAVTIHTATDGTNIDTQKSAASVTSAKAQLDKILSTFEIK